MSRRILWLVALFAPALAGCPTVRDAEPIVETPPFSGVEIRIGVPAEMGFRTAWEGPLHEWGAQTGAQCRLTELSPRDGAELFSAFSGDDRQTLAIFPLEQAGELVAAGNLAAIPESARASSGKGIDWSDLFGGLAGKIAARKRVPSLLPLSCPVLVCYYRQDLLNAAGLPPPQTWDEYQQLVDKLESWAPGLTAVEPWSEAFRASMFLARAVSYAQHPSHYSLFFDIESGDPLIDTPGFVRALEAAQRAVAKLDPKVFELDPSDCRKAILNGRAALAIAFEVPEGLSATAEQAALVPSERAGEMAIGFIRLPGSREIYNSTRQAWEPPAEKGVHHVSLCGFAGLAVAVSSLSSLRETEAAWNALAKVGGGNLTSGFPPGVVGLCRESQVQNPEAAIGFGLEGEEGTACANIVAQILRDTRLVAELPVTGRARFRRALADSLAAPLAGTQTADQALQAAARAWRAIVDEIGAARIRDSYRANLGLSPLTHRN